MLLAALKKNYRRIPFHGGLKKNPPASLYFVKAKKKVTAPLSPTAPQEMPGYHGNLFLDKYD